MNNIEEMIKELSDNQKKILKEASEPGSTILFNIKGMIQVLHKTGPFDFIEMGHQDIQELNKKGLIIKRSEPKTGDFLRGEEYDLSPLGKELVKYLK